MITTLFSSSGDFTVGSVLVNTQDIQNDVAQQNISLSNTTIAELLGATINATQVRKIHG